MFHLGHYFKDAWPVEASINNDSNVQDWICDYADADNDCCAPSDVSNSDAFESDLDFSNFIIAIRHDKQICENSFLYQKLGAQYLDYEMKDSNSVFEEDRGTGIFSELGWRYEWSNNLTANVGYQFLGIGNLSTSSLTFSLGYHY